MLNSISLRAWVVANAIVSISDTFQKGKTTGYPCIFATDNKGATHVIMCSKKLTVAPGDSLKPYGDHNVVNGTNAAGEPRLYLSSGGNQVAVSTLFG